MSTSQMTATLKTTRRVMKSVCRPFTSTSATRPRGTLGVRRAVSGWLIRRSIADRKSTRLNSSHVKISYAVFCLKKKKDEQIGMSQAKNNGGVVGQHEARRSAGRSRAQ